MVVSFVVLLQNKFRKKFRSSFWIFNILLGEEWPQDYTGLLQYTSSLQAKNSLFSTLAASSIKNAEYLTQNVLKIAEFPTKRPQALPAPLAAFSRSGPRQGRHEWFIELLYIKKSGSRGF